MTAAEACALSRKARLENRNMHGMSFDQAMQKVEHAAKLGLYEIQLPFTYDSPETMKRLEENGFKLTSINDLPRFVTWWHLKLASD